MRLGLTLVIPGCLIVGPAALNPNGDVGAVANNLFLMLPWELGGLCLLSGVPLCLIAILRHS